MSLTREQHNKIMRILDDRRLEAKEGQRRRILEIEEKIPETKKLSEELIRINGAEVAARFSKDTERAAELSNRREELFAKKRILLSENGYPEDYLELPSYCKKCGDTGYLEDNEKCSCFRLLEADLVNDESGLPDFLLGKSFADLSLSVYDDAAPMPDLPKGAKPYTQKSYMEKVILPRIEKYIENFDGEGSRNIFMTGPSGTGKTYLCACIAKSLMDTGHTVIYIGAGELFGLYSKAEFGRGETDVIEGRISVIESCDLLIADDLGTEFSSDLNRSKLFSLISHRLSEGVSTIISSNMNLKEVDMAYGERVASRIKGEYLVLPFFGTDLRLKLRAAADRS